MSEKLYYNGLLPDGSYVQAPLKSEEMASRIRAAHKRKGNLMAHVGVAAGRDDTVRPVDKIKPNELDQTGWAVIFPEGQKERLSRALKPLLDLRRDQVGGSGKIFRRLEYHRDEDAFSFLIRVGGSLGLVEPENLPYYLLLVGSPEEIPFEFQFVMDIQYAVGRIHFDTLAAYTQYAKNVVAAEQLVRPDHVLRQAVFFGPDNKDDPSTEQSHRLLIRGLAKILAPELDGVAEITPQKPENTTKAELKQLMGGPAKPDLLFFAGHGLVFPTVTHPLQMARQGALVCGEWRRPLPLRRKFTFGVEDVDPHADLTGMILFCFGCCAGGTDTLSSFPPKPGISPQRTSTKPFVAHLPKLLLSREGGCQAVIAHVDLTYPWFFAGLKDRDQTQIFQDCFLRLLRGQRLGWAMEAFHATFAERKVIYDSIRAREMSSSFRTENGLLIHLWHSINDARNYLVLGDPATKLN